MTEATQAMANLTVTIQGEGVEKVILAKQAFGEIKALADAVYCIGVAGPDCIMHEDSLRHLGSMMITRVDEVRELLSL